MGLSKTFSMSNNMDSANRDYFIPARKDAPIIKQDKPSSFGNNPDIVAAALNVYDLKTPEQINDKFQDGLKQLSALLAGDDSILAGARANGSVGQAVLAMLQKDENNKKIGLLLALLNLNEQLAKMEEILGERIALMNDLAIALRLESIELLQRSLKKFNMADELEDLIEVCEEDMKDGSLSKDNRTELIEKIKEARKTLGLDPIVLVLLSDEELLKRAQKAKENLRQSATKDQEEAHEASKTADELEARAKELAEKLKAIQNSDMSPEEKKEAYEKLLNDTGDKTLFDRAKNILAKDHKLTAAMNDHDTSVENVQKVNADDLKEDQALTATVKGAAIDPDMF